ncbi:unnamed protein product [Nezara viridula]|uniref:Protein smoothened n=1 Tax=Nezara viridula TaxID=85310 RepID=A0A9P0HSN8_NEZVI|nr:unnamed protein product [Nezara viridula]
MIFKNDFSLLLFSFFTELSVLTSARTTVLNPDNLNALDSNRGTGEPERILKHGNGLSWHRVFSSSLGDGLDYCSTSAKCIPLNYTTCMGTKLPYSHTTLDLVDGLSSQEQAQEILRDWRRLIHIPRCWAVIQPFLCALYMPRCEDDKVYLPSQEMCRIVMGPCRILTTYEPWPPWFQCDNTTRFPPRCKNDVRELKFNTTGRCLEPLVQTDVSSYYYPGIDGCGIQCDNPMFPPTQRDQIHKMVGWVASICSLLNIFAVFTFIIDWRHSNKYPALVIFYINLCFFVVCMGWLVQFLPGGREDVVCRKDGTLRTGEPSAGENLSCVVVFVMVYYFLMAATAWFVILTYAWHISLQALGRHRLGKIQECMEKKGAYFHLIAWSAPLVLTITTMALGEIDGDSITGICFVGYTNRFYRVVFLLGPVFTALLIGAYFMSKGLMTLIRLKVDSEEIISERASAKIRETILRMGIFSGLLLTFGFITFICHYYEGRNSDLWDQSFKAYILCKLGVGESECRMESRPSLAMLQIHILALFLSGGLMSTWVWTQTTFESWQRFIRRRFSKETDNRNGNHTKLRKHKVIAQAYAKRKGFPKSGRLSISLESTHQDPVGLKFELNSEGSGSVRSSWAAALPKLVQRRGALVAATNSNSSHRRNSMDSEISYSVRRVSVESRRHSVDSAVSVKVSEVTQTLVKKVKTPFHKKNHRSRRRSHRRQRRHSKQHGSQSSNDKDMALQNISKLVMDMPKTYLPDLGRRRAANVGLDGDPMALLANQLFTNNSGTSSSGSSSVTSPTASPKDHGLDILKDIDQVQDQEEAPTVTA